MANFRKFAGILVYFNEVEKPEKMRKCSIFYLKINELKYQDLVGCKCCIRNHLLVHHNIGNLTLKDCFPHNSLSLQLDLDHSLYSLNMPILAWKKAV